jgi:gliding motility-associated-like protein
MKKIILLLVFIGFHSLTWSQFVVTGQSRSIQLTGSAVTGLQAVFLFNGITPDNQISFTGQATSYLWTKFDGSFVSNQSAISIEDGTGYVLTAGGVKYYVWVIDYHDYPVQLQSITPVNGTDACSQLTLQLSGTIPALTYRDSLGVSHQLSRQFTLTYKDESYVNGAWASITQTQTMTAPVNSLVVDAPYCDTQFTLSGDQYAAQFGMPTPSITSSLYSAIRTESHPTGTIIERTALNEAGREIGPLEGSAPLNVDFESNANTPVTQFYEWYIYNNNTPGSYLRYTDTNLRYEFTQTGTYKVVLVVTNGANTCSYSDSLAVTVSESYLDVPNVFTPNGDGINDQFRVSYRSIVQFQMLLYSSWAGKVYESTDPGQGWDGRVNGKLSPPGVYYYIITATGADGKHYKLKGSVSLLRSKEDK